MNEPEKVDGYDLTEKKLLLLVAAPRSLRDREPDRQVTFLELFHDLVYVVLIAELAHALAGHTDFAGLAGYAFLFVIVWWAWLNGNLYHDLHGNNDIRTRVFTFLQMFTVASVAVFAHDALAKARWALPFPTLPFN